MHATPEPPPPPFTPKKSYYEFLVQIIEKRFEINEQREKKFPIFFLVMIDRVQIFQKILIAFFISKDALCSDRSFCFHEFFFCMIPIFGL